MEQLTRRQAQILQFIRDTLEASGYPPTRAEISRHFDFSSPNAAEDHLRALARKGAIELIAGASRGIRHAELRHHTMPRHALPAALAGFQRYQVGEPLPDGGLKYSRR